jgi:cation diffusion facilitator family transporter
VLPHSEIFNVRASTCALGDWMLSMDFDREVDWVCDQPLRLRYVKDGRSASAVANLLVWRAGTPELCDVKMMIRVESPEFRAQVRATGLACAEAGKSPTDSRPSKLPLAPATTHQRPARLLSRHRCALWKRDIRLETRQSACSSSWRARPSPPNLFEMPGPRQNVPLTAPLAPAGSVDGAAERRTAIESIFAAALLMALTLGTGLVSGSLGLVSSGVDSSGDVVAAIVTFFAVRLGARPADSDHPYGHRRAENLSALAEATILLAGGAIVVVEAIVRVASGSSPLAARWYVFAVILVAIAVDLGRVFVSLRSARRYQSAALRSNAFHFASDTAGAFAVLAGLIADREGFPDGDAIAAMIVAIILFAAAARLISENARVLMDTAPAAAEESAREAIAALSPQIELHRLRLRESAGRYFADVVVSVPPGRAVIAGHAAADEVERAVGEALPNSDVVVHVEPRRRGLDLRDRVLAIALSEPLVLEAHDITIFEHSGRVSVSLHLKFLADSSLAEAHAIAERIEAAIGDLSSVADVRTHLEPLERPIAPDPTEAGDDSRTADRIRALVHNETGKDALDVRILPTERGIVVFLDVSVSAGASLADAHQQASELEEALRQQLPQIADVVVHTEP